MLEDVKDGTYKYKTIILKATKNGSIVKNGANSYSIPGMEGKFTYPELIKNLKDGDENQMDFYLKIYQSIR